MDGRIFVFMKGKRVRLKSTGKVYIIYADGISNIRGKQGQTFYYCNLEKDGKPWGPTKQFTTDQLEFLR